MCVVLRQNCSDLFQLQQETHSLGVTGGKQVMTRTGLAPALGRRLAKILGFDPEGGWVPWKTVAWP